MVNTEEDKNLNGENNETVDVKQCEYLPLNPVSDKAYEPDAKLLFDKIKDPDVRNIGLIGAYGSGKSSLIRTFKDTYDGKYKIKSLNVSLASFNVDSCGDKQNSKQNDKQKDTPVKGEHKTECVNDNYAGVGDIDNAIEKSILQQMLYVESASKLPYSKINRVEPIPIKKYVQLGIMAVCFLSLVVCLVNIFSNISNSSVGIFKYLFEQKTWSTIISLGAIIVLVVLLVRTIKIARIKFHQVEIDINNAQGSLLNRFLDEVLYFFTKTKYKVVIFEDLDRFNNLNIFVKLRELNTILNSNKKIAKQGKITFVYAVKTDIFSEHTERTKFFDFILNVYPTLSPENACAIINEGLKKSRLGEKWLSEDFKYDISFFIMDRRILNSVINDCVHYIKNCNKPNAYNTVEKHILLFSVMLYKNVCPNEYADLERHKGELIELMAYVEENRSNQIILLKKELQKAQQRLQEVDDSFDLTIIRNLIKGLLITINNHAYGLNIFNNINVNDIKDFTDINQTIYLKDPHNTNYFYYAKIDDLNKKLDGNTLDLMYKTPQKIEEHKKECENIRKQINTIPQNNYEYIKKYSDEVFDKKPVSLLLRALLVNGYISENYVDYISLGNEKSMSAKDVEFCQLVVSKGKPRYEADINASYVVIEKLSADKFLLRSILNINIINYLFEHQKNTSYKEKINNLITLFTSRRSEIEEFINCYFSDIRYYRKPFVDFLVDNEVSFISLLIGSSLEQDEQVRVIKDLLCSINSEKLIKQESISLIGDLLQIDDDFNRNIDKYKAGFIVLKEIDYKISDITQYDYDISALNLIREQNLWKINYINLVYIVSRLYEKSEEEIKKQGITLIKMLDVNTMDYILSDKPYYVHDVMLMSDMLELNESDFKDLLLDDKISIDDKLAIIPKQQTPMQYMPSLSVGLQTALLSNNKVQVKYQDLNALLSTNSDNKELKSAIAKYMYIHSEDFKDFSAKTYINLAYCIVNDESYDDNRLIETYFERLTGITWDVRLITNEESIIYMLNKNIIAINPNNIKAISDNYSKASKVLVENNIDFLLSNNLINDNLARAYIESDNRKLEFVSKLCMMANLNFVEGQPFAFKLADIIIDAKIQICDNLYNRIVGLDTMDTEKHKSRELFVSQWKYIKDDEQKIKDKLSKIDYDVYKDLVNNGQCNALDAKVWRTDGIISLLQENNLITLSGRKYLTIKWVGVKDKIV